MFDEKFNIDDIFLDEPFDEKQADEQEKWFEENFDKHLEFERDFYGF